MTIDERLEKLAERHEALAQSVELLTADVRQISAEVREIGTSVKRLAETAANHDSLISQILEAIAHNNETVANLALIARVHSERLERLEKGRR